MPFNNIETAMHCVFVAIEVVIFYYYYKHFLGKKYGNQVVYIIVFALYYVVNLLFVLFSIKVEIIPLLTLAFCVSAAAFLYKGTMFQRLFAAGLIVAYSYVSEIFTAVLLSWLSDLLFSTVLESPVLYFIGNGTSKALLFSIVLLITIKRKSLLLPTPVSHRIILLFIITICAFLSYSDMYSALNSGNSATLLHVLSEFGIMILSVLSFFVFEGFQNYANNEVHAKVLEQQLFQDEKYFQQIEQNQKELRSLKHDQVNHLLTMRQLSHGKDFNALLEYVNQYLEDTQIIISETPTDIPSIDALLSVKKISMQEKGIQFIIKSGHVSNVMINPTYLNIILSNALDNAIEACEKLSPELPRHISLGLKTEDGYLYIQMINSSPFVSFDEDGVPITSKPDRIHHGLGVGSIKRIIELHSGISSFEYDGIDFTFMARLKNISSSILSF